MGTVHSVQMPRSDHVVKEYCVPLKSGLHGSHVAKIPRDNRPGAQEVLTDMPLFSPKWGGLEQRFSALEGCSQGAEVRG